MLAQLISTEERREFAARDATLERSKSREETFFREFKCRLGNAKHSHFDACDATGCWCLSSRESMHINWEENCISNNFIQKKILSILLREICFA